jgi:dTMP kinase
MFVVIEGIDGSGKGSVTKALQGSLQEAGITVQTVSFPRYTETLYGKLVGRYLNGDFGKNTHPYLHSTLFSIDRYESKPYLESLLKDNDVVIADRYIPSALCYSAMKTEEGERDELIKHFVTLEYGLWKMPVPDIMFFLDVPTSFAIKNIAQKNVRGYTTKPKDLHEEDEVYLDKVRSFYLNDLMSYHPVTRYEIVGCMGCAQLLPIAVIGNELHTRVVSLLKGNH